MTPELLLQCHEAGLTQAEIMALEAFYALRDQAQAAKGEGGKGVRGSAVLSTYKQQTAIDNRESVSITPFDEITALSHALFGGFTPSQVRRLLSVINYKGLTVDDLKALMYELRRQSWARGWVRTRDAVCAMARVA